MYTSLNKFLEEEEEGLDNIFRKRKNLCYIQDDKINIKMHITSEYNYTNRHI